MMIKSICFLFGHIYLYDFPYMSNKRICKRCNKKQQLDWNTFRFDDISHFEGDKRSNDQLKDKWVDINY